MNENKNLSGSAYLLGFTLIPEIGPSRFEKITKNFPSLEKAWRASEKELLSKGIEEKTVSLFCQKRLSVGIEKEFEKFSKSGFLLISKDEPTYPERLKEISSAPYALFCHGNTDLLDKKQIAVVGTRIPTNYGKMATEKLCQGLANAGFVITSGMANGIDSIAHKSALEAGAPTIAVLGEGLALLARKFFAKKLMEEIVGAGGLIISEYHPSARATKFTFPARNRIISGLSLGTLVIEAGEKSGSLITANCALEQNREVFAVPGSIFSPQSMGTSLLLKNGAQPVTSANDILAAFQFAPLENLSAPPPNFESEIERTIYSQLTLEPIHIDILAKKCALGANEVSSTLSIMELRGIAKNIGGGMFIKQ